ncbi:MAG: DUF3899 domain-containing protein [Clostridia bacterium]|nr:DUF3899 domain-containing protein [Clostridia bacterium]
MKDFLKKALPYIITAAVGIIIFVIIICAKTIWNAGETKEVMRILSDASFVSGVLLAGVGLIIFASNGGAFDMLGYAFIRIFDLFRKDARNKKYKDFYEYREAKKGKKRGMAFMLIVGLAFIAFAVIFLIVYYQY